MRSGRLHPLAVVFVLTVLTTACGGDGGDSAGSTIGSDDSVVEPTNPAASYGPQPSAGGITTTTAAPPVSAVPSSVPAEPQGELAVLDAGGALADSESPPRIYGWPGSPACSGRAATPARPWR